MDCFASLAMTATGKRTRSRRAIQHDCCCSDWSAITWCVRKSRAEARKLAQTGHIRNRKPRIRSRFDATRPAFGHIRSSFIAAALNCPQRLRCCPGKVRAAVRRLLRQRRLDRHDRADQPAIHSSNTPVLRCTRRLSIRSHKVKKLYSQCERACSLKKSGL